MTTPRLIRYAASALFAAAPAFATSAAAQLIQIRTVPVATGDQFLTTPSLNFGLGGLGYAVDDSLADGWSNPAKGALLSESSLMSAPTYFQTSDRGGGGLTFPVAGLIKGESWFGGVTAAMQDLDADTGRRFRTAGRLSEISTRNLYAGGFLGRRLGDGWALGVGASFASLEAMAGVDRLYADAERIDQDGSVRNVQLGAYREADRDRVSAVLVHHAVSMTHAVTYAEVVSWRLFERVEFREETNLDRTRTWGLQLGWDRRLEAPGWRIGASMAANRKSHPKIPNYTLQNIPRDPGNSLAWELGFGIARSLNGTTAGVDVALQPISSDTWQEAEEATETERGATIPVGGKTIENRFSFLNFRLRVGVGHQFSKVGLRMGLEGRSYDYTLEQTDNVEATFRTQDESWIEWTPAASAVFRLGSTDLHYGLRVTTGTGQPGVEDGLFANAPDSGGDFVVAPEAPLTLVDASVVTHQFWVRIPVR